MKKVLVWSAKGFVRWLKDFFIDTFKELNDSVIALSRSPLLSGISLAIVTARVIALIMLVFAYSSYISNGGYGRQIAYIGAGISQWSGALTTGTLSEYMYGFSAVACTVLIILSFLAIYVAYVVKETGLKKALMIVLIVFLFYEILLYFLFIWGYIYDLALPINSFRALYLHLNHNKDQQIVAAAYVITLILALTGATAMTMRSPLKRQMKQWLSTVLSVYIALPLLLWFAQNLIPLAAMAILCAIVYALLALLSPSPAKKTGMEPSGEPPPGEFHPGDDSSDSARVRKRRSDNTYFDDN